MTNNNRLNAIAIDGPAASGKTTIGHMLANRINFLLLDTGCMYRAVTLAAIMRGIEITNSDDVLRVAKEAKIDIKAAQECDDGRLYTVLLNHEDVTWQIRSHEVDLNVSQVSAYKRVRQELVRRQREIAEGGRVVVVGRDIGTVVLPDAPLKLYIVASAEERAKRRWEERQSREDNLDLARILDDIRRRDQFDGQRRYSPMRPAADAVIINTDGKSPEEVLRVILALSFFQPGGLFALERSDR